MALVNQAVCSNCGRSDCDGRIWEDAEDPTRTWHERKEFERLKNKFEGV